MEISKLGNVRAGEVHRRTLLRNTGLPVRDLRRIDSNKSSNVPVRGLPRVAPRPARFARFGLGEPPNVVSYVGVCVRAAYLPLHHHLPELRHSHRSRGR